MDFRLQGCRSLYKQSVIRKLNWNLVLTCQLPHLLTHRCLFRRNHYCLEISTWIVCVGIMSMDVVFTSHFLKDLLCLL